MDKKITYTNEVLDSYSGQLNCEAGIYVDNEIIGVVQYVLYENELTISNIFVRPEFRRMGYGSRLIRYIKEQNPDYLYKPSLKTDLGLNFKHKKLSLTEDNRAHFIRGKDPKEAMDIGIRRKMFKMIQNLYMEFRSAAREYFRDIYYEQEVFALKKTLCSIYYDKIDPNKAFTDACNLNKVSEKEKEHIREIMKRELGIEVKYIPTNESQNFERGQDPKKSMNIGMIKIIPKLIEDLLRYDQEERKNILLEVRFYSDSVEFCCDVGEEEKERVDYVHELINKFHLNKFIKLTPVYFYHPMGIVNYLFYLTPSGEKVNPVKRYYLDGITNNFTIEDNTTKFSSEDFPFVKILQESQHFERGINPKRAMKIGQYSRAEEFKNFIEEKLEWNGARIIINDNGTFTYECFPGQSIISYLKEAIEEFGWGEKMKINVIDNSSRGDPDGTSFHYYRIAFKKNLKESLDFERGKDPLDALDIGDVVGRTFKRGKEKVKNAIEMLAKENNNSIVYEGSRKERPTIQYTYEAGFYKTKTLTFSINYLIWFAGRAARISHEQYCTNFSTPNNPNGEDGTTNDYCFNNVEECIETIRKWIKDNIGEKYDYVTETQNFERGQDPKKSMDVGLNHKYGKFYDLFVICHNLSTNSENFTYVSDIVFKKDQQPFFNIESVFYYTDEDNIKIPEGFVITLWSDEILCLNTVTKDEDFFKTEEKFIKLTTCWDEIDNLNIH